MTDVAAASAAASTPPQTAWRSASGFGFRDILDIVNPLQHLPIIGTVYRWLTGDRPGEAAKVAGDAVYGAVLGGPIGVGLAVATDAANDSGGRDLGERALDYAFGPRGSNATAVASAVPASPTAAAPDAASASASAPPHPAATATATAPTVGTPLAMSQASQPIPLFGGIAQPVPAISQNAAQAFEAHQAQLERSIRTGRPGSAPTAPVPLVLPAGTFLNRIPLAPAAAPATAAAPAPDAPVKPPNAAQPTDVSQKMLDALDKYMQFQREKKDGGAPPPAGSSVDLAL